jgi:hypothetical protein
MGTAPDNTNQAHGSSIVAVPNSKNPMKTILHGGISSLAAVMLLGMAGAAHAQQTNFGVTTPSFTFQYFIDGTNNTGTGQNGGAAPTNNSPPLTLTAGQTYTFSINTATFHPMAIVSDSPGPAATYYPGATPTSTNLGTMTLVIPATGFPTTLYYQCNVHYFYGVITVVPPVANVPPSNHIISIVLTPTTVTMTSDGTNTTYNLVPQFNSNVVDGLWHDVPSFTNVFASGTNTTSFGRLDSICGPNVFLRISQRPP